MEIVALVLGGVLLVGLAAYVNRDTPARREKVRWLTTGKNLGLTGGVGSLSGNVDGITLKVRLVDAESRRPTVEVVASGGLDPELRMRQWQEGTVRDGNFKSGDKAFDQAYVVHGEPLATLAALDSETRAHLLDYAGGREVIVAEGAVTMRVLGAAADLARLMDAARQCVALAKALTVDADDVVPRVARSARTDPSARTRLTSLNLLIEHQLDTDETREAIQAALSDDDAHVRIAGALQVGAKGTAILEEILEDPDAPYQLRDKAAFQISNHVSAKRVREVLETYLVDGHPLRKKAVEQMIARGADPGLGPLMTMLRSDDPDEICVGARCVGAHGYKQAEVTLVQLVTHDDKRVQVGAVHALGQVGTKRALGVLKKTTVSSSAGVRLKRAAKEAVRRIEARASIVS